ncbi:MULTISPECIES: PQQ-binding-like beta-propeller repeat protein [unclassified Streptomyces]|uniref:protein kinase domain-containing protein n=1 Tax=unclassified Streptomyces TaxID=2593676 RepID=UPI000CD5AF6A|nr:MULTISPECIES: PQQ-binding-like beta-propeller repeat protein [unclassified Streptomyces]
MHPLESGDPISLGPYHLRGVLGEGGMGRVYVGQDAQGQVAAVKVLHAHLAHDPDLARRFVREAQMARAVTGEGVARVLDTRTDGGRPWIASEFLIGPTLDEAVRDHGPLGEPAVRVLAVALARALRDIHAAGLIHRDLKPSNIVLTSSGPRIIDFGIARPEHGFTLTTTGQIPVTPGYGAPEQVLGLRVGPAADLFSLGAVLAYASSGQRTYEGAHVAAVQYEVVHGVPRLQAVPDALRPLIAPLLARDPAYRPTPDQLIPAFAPPRGAGRVWRKGPIARDVTERERSLGLLTTQAAGASGKPVARRRVLTALAVGGVVAAGGGGAVWWRGRADGPFEIPPAVATPKARPYSAERGDYVHGQAPEPLWTVDSAADEQSPAPLPVRDVIVTGAPGGGLVARRVVDGSVAWQAPDPDAVRRYVSLSDRLVAAADRDGVLRTYVASTGEPKWTADAEVATVLAADDDAVYVVTEDGRVRSIGRSDGRVRWTADAGIELTGKSRARGEAAPGRLVVAGTHDVVALATGDGRRAWTLRDQAEERPGLAVGGDIAVVTGHRLVALDAGSGKERWEEAPKPAEGVDLTPFYGPPTIAGPYVFAALVGEPRRPTLADGKVTAGVYEGLLLPQCAVHSPLVVHGDGFWSAAVDGGKGGVNVVDLAGKRRSWMFPLIDHTDRYWLTADGGRVFLTDGTSLTALPVF